MRKKVPTTIRVVNKLQEEGSHQAPDISFGSILEVEVVVCDQCRSQFSHLLDVLDDSRPYQQYKLSIPTIVVELHTKGYFYRTPLRTRVTISSRGWPTR